MSSPTVDWSTPGWGRDADQDIPVRAEVLHDGLREARVLEPLAQLLRHHRVVEADLDQRAAGEVEAPVEAEEHEGDDRHDEEARGDARGDDPRAHEVEIGLSHS